MSLIYRYAHISYLVCAIRVLVPFYHGIIIHAEDVRRLGKFSSQVAYSYELSVLVCFNIARAFKY